MNYLNTLSIESLLLLRIAFDNKGDVVNLHQDMMDLYLFPERLESSYKDEWQAYIKRALAKAEINEASLMEIMKNRCTQETDQVNVLEARLLSAKSEYLELSQALRDAQQQQNSDNVKTIKTPLHNWLEWVIT